MPWLRGWQLSPLLLWVSPGSLFTASVSRMYKSLFFSGFVLDNMMSKLGTSDEVPSIWWESWASTMLASSLVIAFCLSLQWKLTGYTVHFVLEPLHALPSPVLNSICYFFVFVSHFSWCKSFSWCFNICSRFAKIQCPNFLGVGNCDAMRMFC